jgi:cell division septum initiation protein DivIVA
MSVELHADDRAARPLSALQAVPDPEPPARSRPNVSGDLPTVFQAAPMFRRAVAGYDRFQVDTYVQWAEDELATADREREHLLARHLRTRAELEEARQLLSHSSEGGELLRLSRRIGSMLAAAADEADGMRAEAEADRTAASAEAERMVAHAELVLADAHAQAERTVAEAAGEVREMTAGAARIVDEAEDSARRARDEAEARLEQVRMTEQRAAEDAARIREQAVQEASAARLQARDEVVRMLITGREERRRADAEAAATRERLDRDAAARRASLLAEVEDLEHRRADLRAELDRAPEPVTRLSHALLVRVRTYLERIQDRLGSHLAAWRSVPSPSASVGTRDAEARPTP